MSCETKHIDPATITEFNVEKLRAIIKEKIVSCEAADKKMNEDNLALAVKAKAKYDVWYKLLVDKIPEFHTVVVRPAIKKLSWKGRKNLQDQYPNVDFDTAMACSEQAGGVVSSDWWCTLVASKTELSNDPHKIVNIVPWFTGVTALDKPPATIIITRFLRHDVTDQANYVHVVEWLKIMDEALSALEGSIVTASQIPSIKDIFSADKAVKNEEINYETVIKK